MTVTGIHHFAVAVPDLAEADSFYTDFGLETRATGGGLAARCPGRPHDEVVVVEGPEKRLHHIGFRTDDARLEQLKAKLTSIGTSVTEDPPRGAQAGGVWFQDLHGVWINVVVFDPGEPSPFNVPTLNIGDTHERVDVAAWTTYDRTPRPRQLGHFVIFTPDLYASEAWYANNLGLTLSDRSLGKASFMRTGDGYHHTFAVVGTSDHNGFHHASFEMAGPDEIVLGTRQMSDKGHDQTWGLGRHTIGSNLFSYIQDPWGSWCEYFADMDMVTSSWEPSDVEAPPHVWSPPVEPDFFSKKFFYNAEPA